MAAKKGQRKAAPVEKATNIRTDANLNPTTQRMRLGAYSFPSLSTFQGRIYEEAKQELRFPESSKLYKQMGLDPNISSAIGLIEMLIEKVQWRIDVSKSASEAEKERQKKLQWNLLSMRRPWVDYVVEILSYLQYGFHVPEKIYKKFTGTPYGDFTGIYDLATVSQDTISQWIFEKGTGHLAGLRQDLRYIMSDGKLIGDIATSYVDIPRKKFMLFRHSPKRDNPEGTSPLRSCYVSWKHRNLIEEYETIGTAKDLGGTPVIGVDVQYLSKATNDPTGDEAAIVAEMKRQAASLHAGDQAYVMKPLAYDSNGKELFTFDLIGISGGGKQYDTDTIVKRHDTKILMAFFADVLKLGSDQHGSFALADSKTTLLSMAVERHLQNIAKVFNHDLMPQIYELNGWTYDPETACKFAFGDVEKQSLEDVSKFIQRVFSVGAMRPTEQLETELRKLLFNKESFKEDSDVIIEAPIITKAGEGMAAGGGNGTSRSASKRDSSSSNSENA